MRFKLNNILNRDFIKKVDSMIHDSDGLLTFISLAIVFGVNYLSRGTLEELREEREKENQS